MCLAPCLDPYRPLAQCRSQIKCIKKCVLRSARAGRQVKGLTREATFELYFKADLVLAHQQSVRKSIRNSVGEGTEIRSSTGYLKGFRLVSPELL